MTSILRRSARAAAVALAFLVTLACAWALGNEILPPGTITWPGTSF